MQVRKVVSDFGNQSTESTAVSEFEISLQIPQLNFFLTLNFKDVLAFLDSTMLIPFRFQRCLKYLNDTISLNTC